MWLGIAIAVGLIVWAVGGLLALNPLPWQIRKYWDAPGAKELRIIQAIALLLIIAGVTVFFVTESGTFWHDLWPEMISTGGAVLGIDELNRRRSAQEYKQGIIRQMASGSNEFTLDAARIITNEYWHMDGSLKGADLRFANLAGAELVGVNLTQATLIATDFTGVDFCEAILTEAVYNRNTHWPEGFDAKSRGAVNWDELSKQEHDKWWAKFSITHSKSSELPPIIY